MFVDFITSVPGEGSVVITSAIRSIDVSTDAPAVRFAMSADGDQIYTSVLYAYDGRVSLPDPGSVVESWMRSKSIHRATVRITVSCVSDPSVFASKYLDCLFCSYALPDTFDPESVFFVSRSLFRVAADARFPLYGPVSAGDPVTVLVSGVDAAGAPASGMIQARASDGFITVDMAAWIKHVGDNDGVAVAGMVSVRSGNLEHTLAILREPQYLQFRFRNGFNLPEPVYLTGISTLKPEVSVDSAVCDGRLTQYNRRLIRTYEHVSGPLTRSEAASLVQMLESEHTQVVYGGSIYDIVITDHSTEVSSDDSSINVLKFSWQFADRRPHLFGDDLDPLLSSSGIFTDQFRPQYM